MASVHGKDTAIEQAVRSYLHEKGYRFRKNVASLPGSPDIVLREYKAVVFVHGCFWHGHSGCRRSRLPTTRRDFWEEKRRANLERDARKVTELLNAGWRVAIVWQCALARLDNFRGTMNALEDWIHADDEKYEVPKSMKTLSSNSS